jgi:hypothetical protein
MSYCEDCGCKVYNGACTNCHEEVFIFDQYIDQEMELPDNNSKFMKKVRKCESEIATNQKT